MDDVPPSRNLVMDIAFLSKKLSFRKRCEESGIGPYPVGSTDKRIIERHLSCTEYDRCLTYVVDLNWQLFTCRGCVMNPATNLINIEDRARSFTRERV